MKQRLLKIATIMIAMITVLSMHITAFAANDTIQEYLDQNGGFPNGTSSLFTTDSSKLGNVTFQTYTLNGTQYYLADSDEAAVVGKINASIKNAEAIQTLNDVTTGMDIGADVTTASGMLSGFYPVISVVIGLIVILISIGMTIFSAFDLCYIAFPVFRNHCEEAKQSGQSGLTTKTNKTTGETKLRFVSDDAVYSVNAADTTQRGKNPFVIYFGKRIVSYVVLAVLLFILMTGRITIFTDLALRVMSGITDLIQSM